MMRRIARSLENHDDRMLVIYVARRDLCTHSMSSIQPQPTPLSPARPTPGRGAGSDAAGSSIRCAVTSGHCDRHVRGGTYPFAELTIDIRRQTTRRAGRHLLDRRAGVMFRGRGVPVKMASIGSVPLERADSVVVDDTRKLMCERCNRITTADSSQYGPFPKRRDGWSDLRVPVFGVCFDWRAISRPCPPTRFDTLVHLYACGAED